MERGGSSPTLLLLWLRGSTAGQRGRATGSEELRDANPKRSSFQTNGTRLRSRDAAEARAADAAAADAAADAADAVQLQAERVCWWRMASRRQS
jgi:hypothetical protein